MHAPALTKEKISILMVEDEGNEALIIHRLLHDIDHEFNITLVSRFDDALAELAKHKKDVVILDLGLPDSNGPQSVKMLTQRYPDLPIVVISGRSDMATVQSALEYGAQEFVSKNDCSGNIIRQALLASMVRKSLEKRH